MKGECDDYYGKILKVVGYRYEQNVLYEFMEFTNIFNKKEKSF